MVISSGLAHGSEAEGCASGLANETNADGEQGIAQRSREWQESGTDRADYTGPIDCGGEVISNGVVQLGVNCYGSLVAGGVGLKYLPTGSEAIAVACLCEGWRAGAGSGYWLR